MAGRGWTRQWALALFVLSAALLGGCGKEERAAKAPGRQFNSKLAFCVYALVEEGQPPKVVGETPSAQPLAIPSCRTWWVEPLGPRDMAAVASELDAQGIPGLKLFPASDDSLVHVKGLKGLLCLNLSSTQVTDAGLAHLKDLKGLKFLDLERTRVTDAGIAELKKSLPNVMVAR